MKANSIPTADQNEAKVGILVADGEKRVTAPIVSEMAYLESASGSVGSLERVINNPPKSRWLSIVSNPCYCMMEHHNTAKSPNIRTLLVHDSPKMLKTLSQIVTSEEGFTVVGSATDGCQALRNASALGPDLVLMGLHLSKLSAVQTTSHIKQLMNPPVVFLVSSHNSQSSRAMSKVAGADGIIESSPDLEVSLRSRLQEWFGPNTPCPAKSRKAPRAFSRPVGSVRRTERGPQVYPYPLRTSLFQKSNAIT